MRSAATSAQCTWKISVARFHGTLVWMPAPGVCANGEWREIKRNVSHFFHCGDESTSSSRLTDQTYLLTTSNSKQQRKKNEMIDLLHTSNLVVSAGSAGSVIHTIRLLHSDYLSCSSYSCAFFPLLPGAQTCECEQTYCDDAFIAFHWALTSIRMRLVPIVKKVIDAMKFLTSYRWVRRAFVMQRIQRHRIVCGVEINVFNKVKRLASFVDWYRSKTKAGR